MEPLYSVLLCNQQYSEYKERISKWLAKGIKVIWFGQDENVVDELKTTFKKYAKVFLLQAFVIEFIDQACILDGENATDFVISKLETGCPLFNAAQYLVEHCKADEHIEVQASAGTGKTTVMIDRILYLMHTQPDLHLPEIYMVTFTNDATNQMNKRLQDALVTRYDLTRDEKYLRWLEEQSQMNISTIHSFAYQMLREYGIGESFTKNLSIRSFQYEKKEIIKDMVDGKIDDSKSIRGQLGVPFYRANGILNQFWGRFLQLGVSHEDMLKMDWGEPVDDESKSFHKVITETIPKLDDKYFAVKRKNDGVGLDDIMRDLQEVLTSEYLPKPDISMKYLFIDEFQDSDLSQIKVACYFVKLLGAVLFVVGDVKQSIYRFRGATIENILNFEKQFQNAVVIRLEQNYRSTKTILEAANDVIAHNAGRKEKTLWTDLEDGKKIIWYKAVDETDESRFVAEKIEKEVQNGASYQDFAVLYRMNAQSNNIERMFVKEKIPYHIYGGTRFYDRKEIKDVLAYMTILYNPFDMVRFKRIVNEPKRGIGDATMEMLENITRDLGISPIDVMRDSETYPVLSKKVAHLKKFALMIDELTDAVKTMQLDEFFDLLLQKTGYADYLKNMGEEGKIRLENVQELKSNILKYMKESELPSLENFLEEVSLYADAEQTETTPDTVSMMTIHAAKGLEFKTVFLIGMEENIFPSARSINSLDENDLEEERRLAYVAITRAKKQLCVSTTDRRMLFGMTTSNPRSRFLGEIQGDCMEQVQSKKNVAAGTRKVEMVQSISLQQQLASRRNHHPQKTAAKSVNYSVGARVRHKIFGEGTILSVTDMANDSMLEIGFDQVGTKKVMANFASSKMQVIS